MCNVHKTYFSLGLDKIEFLQSHENTEVYQKAFDIIERYFGVEDEDAAIEPAVDETNQQFQFGAPAAPNAEGGDAAQQQFQF